MIEIGDMCKSYKQIILQLVLNLDWINDLES